MIRPSSLSRAIALTIAFVLLAALVVIAEIAQSGQKQINERIGLSQKRQIVLAELLEQLSQAEAGQRSYLLTGDQKYLQPYQGARDRIEPTLDQFSDLFRDDDRQLANIDQRNILRHLRVLIGTELGELAASLELYTSQGRNRPRDSCARTWATARCTKSAPTPCGCAMRSTTPSTPRSNAPSACG
jgi:CHASE3 domain sensor protein